MESSTHIILLCTTDNSLFYQIKSEILQSKPKYIETTNDGNSVETIYEDDKYTYKIIIDSFSGVRANSISMNLKS
jgi:hypothetical protein